MGTEGNLDFDIVRDEAAWKLYDFKIFRIWIHNSRGYDVVFKSSESNRV